MQTLTLTEEFLLWQKAAAERQRNIAEHSNEVLSRIAPPRTAATFVPAKKGTDGMCDLAELFSE